jgi:hypothetical protein
VDLSDVTPTLLHAVGVVSPSPHHGESLLPHLLEGTPLRTPEVFAETRLPYARIQMWRLGSEKFIFDHLQGVALRFDLDRDPEEKNGQELSPSQKEDIQRWIDTHLAFPKTWSPPRARDP